MPLDGMGKVYEAADVVVVPTLAGEGTSLSVIEAMSLGKPVVTTWVGGIPDLVLDGFNAIVVPPRWREVASALKLLLTDDELRRRIGSNAREAAISFRFGRWKARVRDVFEEVLTRGED